MRLIDADALSEHLDKRRTYEIMGGRNRAYGKGVRDAMNDVDAAPTIPAIPVEWLVNLKNEYAREGREQAEGDLMNLLLMWQKEQEAQDG